MRLSPLKIFFGVGASFFIASFFTFSAHAALYNASGVLGHVDQAGSPIYITGDVNNGPNAQGFSTGGTNNYSGVAVDSVNHRLFVADPYNNRVLVFPLDANDQVASTTASYVLGQADFISSANATTQNGLYNPTNLAYDSVSSRLFVADDLNNRVLVFDAATSTITDGEDAENVLGQSDFTSKTYAHTQSGMGQAQGIDYDPVSSRLFVLDAQNNRVLVFDTATSTITNGENAENVLGQSDFTSTGSATSQSGLKGPTDIAYDPVSSRLFVSGSFWNNRVLVFDAATSTITNGEDAEHVLGQSSFTSTGSATSQSGLNDPNGLTYDASSSRLFVADTFNSRVMIFDAATSTITDGENAEHVLGQSSFTSKDSTVSQGGLGTPMALSFDPAFSRLFVADSGSNRVMIFDAATSTITDGENASGVVGHVDQNGNLLYTASGANNGPNIQGFNTPEGMALDSINHRLFVADSKNNRVLVFPLDAHDNVATTIPSLVLGQANFVSGVGTTTQSGLFSPQSLLYDPISARLFVTDQGNNRILVFDAATSTIADGENAEHVLGQSDFTSSTSATTQSGLNTPDGLAYDASSSRLFVADAHNNRVLVFDAATSTLTDGENAEHVLGQANFTSSTSAVTQSGFTRSFSGILKMALAYDASSSRLFVADSWSNRVLVFDAATSTLTDGENAEHVLGQANFTSSTYAYTQNGLARPDGLAYDPASARLFVTDSSRVVVFDAATSTITDGENAENVLGQPNFTSLTYATTQSGLDTPVGIVFDPTTRKLFIGDQGNNRVLQYSFIELATSSLADGTSGSAYSASLTATSSQGTVSYALASGSLPDGLTLSTSTGIIAGTPTTATSASFTIEADDTFSTGKFFDQKPFTITIAARPAPAATVIVAAAAPPPVLTPPPSNLPPSSSSNPSAASLQSTLANLEAQLQSLIAQAQAQGISIAGISGNETSSGPSSFSPSFPRNLSLWMTGSDVQALQVFLNSHGYPVAISGNGSAGHETQTFGNKTMNALIQFQKDHGIPATGFFGPMTRGEIVKMVK